eukprot:NODE_1530_length_864_cov_480.736196_g1188_i0.p3 GENE.NODE_1530_length_864_cov_480.736196_g1188_i0~~NODE_1530_length_864_cov_480.736196_g1188_i0.p3  ORF type:complete len:151 (+),score=17.95 NODE_1530_length_864_cov_480.736196_g1188_i0:320-772(+)
MAYYPTPNGYRRGSRRYRKNLMAGLQDGCFMHFHYAPNATEIDLSRAYRSPPTYIPPPQPRNGYGFGFGPEPQANYGGYGGVGGFGLGDYATGLYGATGGMDNRSGVSPGAPAFDTSVPNYGGFAGWGQAPTYAAGFGSGGGAANMYGGF